MKYRDGRGDSGNHPPLGIGFGHGRRVSPSSAAPPTCMAASPSVAASRSRRAAGASAEARPSRLAAYFTGPGSIHRTAPCAAVEPSWSRSPCRRRRHASVLHLGAEARRDVGGDEMHGAAVHQEGERRRVLARELAERLLMACLWRAAGQSRSILDADDVRQLATAHVSTVMSTRIAAARCR